MASIWRNGFSLGSRDGMLALGGNDCCCGVCCHFLACDPSAETQDLYAICTILMVELIPGDVIEVDGECYEFVEYIECEGDEVDPDYGDQEIFEDCEDCQCLCAIYQNCCDAEDEVRFKRCAPFTVVIGPGDVIDLAGTCWVYQNGTGCLGGEIEIDESMLVDDCTHCNKCYLLEDCENVEPDAYVRVCDGVMQTGDIVKWNDVCYEVTEVDCDTLEDPPTDIEPADAAEFQTCESCLCPVCDGEINQANFTATADFSEPCDDCYQDSVGAFSSPNSVPMTWEGDAGILFGLCPSSDCWWTGDTGWVTVVNPFCDNLYDPSCTVVYEKRATAAVCAYRSGGNVIVNSRVTIQTRERTTSGTVPSPCPATTTDASVTYYRTVTTAAGATDPVDCRSIASGDHDLIAGGGPTCSAGLDDPINVTYS